MRTKYLITVISIILFTSCSIKYKLPEQGFCNIEEDRINHDAVSNFLVTNNILLYDIEKYTIKRGSTDKFYIYRYLLYGNNSFGDFTLLDLVILDINKTTCEIEGLNYKNRNYATHKDIYK